jgi:guanylate kinase
MLDPQKHGKLIIFSAPSGAGKTTILKSVIQRGVPLHFSVSATTRKPRVGEIHGREYFFLSDKEFRDHIAQGDFIEYEEVYQDVLYGTLKSEVDVHLLEGRHVVFDIDVVGGLNIKNIYGNDAMGIFIMPPDLESLERRLRGRGTESAEVLRNRVEKAQWELSYAQHFDAIIINDSLERAIDEAEALINAFITR